MKMKKILFLAVVLLALVSVLVACGEKEKKPTEQEPSTPEVPDNEATLTLAETNVYEINDSSDMFQLSLSVANDTELLYLYQYIQVKDGVEWILSADIEATGSSIITSKTVQLKEGANTYYILCTGDNNLFEIYTLTIYRRHMYTVSFENLTETQSVEEGGMAALPAGKPQKTGYTFVSWSFNFTDLIDKDVMVSANWKANTYTITYDANGGYVAPTSQSITYGSEVQLPIPSRSGYDFVGWQRGTTTIENGIWEIASDVTLTAVWDYSSFTVTLDPNGGSLETTTVEVRYNAAYQLPTPNRTGYVFKGWYNGDDLFDSTGVWNRMAGLSLTAEWEISDMESISCTMIGNGGTVLPQTQLLPVGSALPTPTRNGYTFGGWFADDVLTTPVTGITKELIDQYGSNLRLYAWWKEEAKPGEFIYELSGIYCLVTGYKSDVEPYPVIPKFIGGREVKVDIKPPVDPNAGITVAPSITLTVGDASVIFATFVPAYPGDSKVLYFSTDSDCIQLGATGAVTALKPGTAVVTIQNEDGTYTATCVLTILGRLNKNPGITVKNPNVTLEEGKNVSIDVTFVPTRVGDSTELFYTVDSDCVKVENGMILAIKPGSAVITIKNQSGNYSATINVTVTERQPDPNAGITPNENEITLEEGQSGQISATVIPAFPEDSTVLIFATESDCIELLEDGSFTAIKEGTAIVKITTSAGLTVTVTVNVTAKPPVADPNAGITPVEGEITLQAGESGNIEATVIPAFPEDSTDLIFATESDCIELGENGSFTAVKEGTAIVKITTSAGLTATVTVNVTAVPESDPEVEPEADTGSEE